MTNSMITPIHRIIAFFLIALGLVSCSPLIKAEQPVQSEFVALESGNTLGQTFLAHYDGLEGIALYLKPGTTGEGTLRLYLRSGPGVSPDLGLGTLPVGRVDSLGFYRFQFPQLKDSTNRDYFFQLEVDGTGAVQAGAADGETYLHGALYEGQIPRDAQLSFRLIYNPTQVVLGLLSEALDGLLWLALAFFLFVIPGWAMLSILWPTWGLLKWPEKLGLACGAGLAFYPLFFLWTDLVRIHLGSLYAWLPPLAGLVIIIWRNRMIAGQILRKLFISPLSYIPYPFTSLSWPSLVFVSVLLLIFGVRLWNIRGLDAPMWGDAYQHTMMAQLFLDNGGIFNSWEPYIPYQGLTVHYGFSATVAVFSWISGIAATPATLLAGQIINGLAILTLYPLAMRISSGNPWAGIGTLLVAGLLSPMPAYYVNWGRYAQLAGLAVLPVALWLLWDSIHPKSPLTIQDDPQAGNTGRPAMVKWQAYFVAGAVLAGMMLHYYRMPFYYATFVMVWLIVWGISNWRFNIRQWLETITGLTVIGVTAVLLFLPWLLRLLGGNLSQAVEAGVSSGSSLEYVLSDFQVWRNLDFFLPRYLWLLILIAAVWGLIQKKWLVPTMVLWVIALAGYFGGQLFRLPGANMMQNFAILIAIYIPAGLMAGWLAGEMSRFFIGLNRNGGQALAAMLILGLAVWGASNLRIIAQPVSFALVTRPDMRAMAWIKNHTPGDANFLVEGFRIYDGRSAVGADAGWWISLLANRKNTMPPQYALLNEMPANPGYTQAVVDLVAGLETNPPASPAGIKWLCENGISHVYIGQRQGKVGDQAKQLFDPDSFYHSSAYKLLYHQDRVMIFVVDPAQCAISQD